MKVEIYKTRTVFTSRDKVGTMNENYIEVLEFTFPEELDSYIKYIEIQAENEEGKLKYVDRIENNRFTLSNSLTKYYELQMQVICRDLNRTVFKSNIFTVTTDESLNIMEDLIEEQEDLFERVERELQEVYQGMEEFKTEIVEDANSRFNTNVTEKTQGFDTNAETKTTDFNNNYDTKTNTFNSNYDEKLGTFNSNATSKLTEYNNNDTAKTGAYNSNATEKLNTYNTNATNKVAEYNLNAETKLNAYNTNATQKLAEYDSLVEELHEDLDDTQDKVEQYNTNIDTKYTQYNTNATEKLNTYNQNATTKTNAYNTNAQTKLEAYNTNAQSKTDDFDTNAEEKLQEYNDNASALMQSVETLEQKHDTEVAELNEKITELETDLEMATDLIPTREATGSDITINDSARYYFKKFEVEGKSEQETFTGKNSAVNDDPENPDANYISSGGGTSAIKYSQSEKGYYTTSHRARAFNLKAGTYTISVMAKKRDEGTSNDAIQLYQIGVIVPKSSLTNEYQRFSKTFTLSAEGNATLTFFNTVYWKDIQLEEGSTATDYEPYTGGQPAPNPDYECPIQNVTGNVDVKVENKNLILATNCLNSTINNDGSENRATNRLSTTYIEIDSTKSNLTFSFNTNFLFLGIALYDSEKTFISRVTTNSNKHITATISSNVKYARPFLSTDTGITLNETTFDTYEMQLEYGSTATPYVAHEEQTVTFPLTEGQILHEGDTIEDKIVQRRKTVSFDGTETWTANGSYNNQYYRYIPTLNNRKQNGLGISNYFSVINNINSVGLYNGVGVNFIIEGIETVADFKAWLAEKYANGTPVTLEYELETPIETEFTEAQATAKAQIDKLYSYKGTTYISSDNEVSPIFNVTYRKDLETMIDNLSNAIVAQGGV